jgi:hypothetical protein
MSIVYADGTTENQRSRNKRKRSIEQRFWSKVNLKGPNECWEWKANLRKGYGMFRISNKIVSAHRVSWTMLRGDIPEGLLVLHKCNNEKCVNPNHLYLGTHGDNVTDMVARRQN